MLLLWKRVPKNSLVRIWLPRSVSVLDKTKSETYRLKVWKERRAFWERSGSHVINVSCKSSVDPRTHVLVAEGQYPVLLFYNSGSRSWSSCNNLRIVEVILWFCTFHPQRARSVLYKEGVQRSVIKNVWQMERVWKRSFTCVRQDLKASEGKNHSLTKHRELQKEIA